MYPIVLAHGFWGFKKIAGIEYFKGVPKYLTRKFPDLNVVVPEVAPNDLIENRALQLWNQVERLNTKVHIIGHSMGGLDGRFMISPGGLNKSDRVVSLTTIGTPHWGALVADFILDKTEKLTAKEIERFIGKIPAGTRQVKKIINIVKEMDKLWDYLLELLNVTSKGMKNLTTIYLQQFNQKYYDAAGVKYYSYAGVTGPGEQDYLPPLLYVPWIINYLSDSDKASGRNDGLVALNSARWGHFKGEVPADHYKQVGWDLSGTGWLRKLVPGLKTFNHLKFYQNILNDLSKLDQS